MTSLGDRILQVENLDFLLVRAGGLPSGFPLARLRFYRREFYASGLDVSIPIE
ncbi:hypothetical protein [Nostoc sp. PCC 7107]|uniref:hypothetical protein n=1 Tax=Nostoc sp. PCC 7107 TaxID=317936 RepID=UPI000318BDFA|nr:hypothetical protein [Nostoc sp. PCC 7107]